MFLEYLPKKSCRDSQGCVEKLVQPSSYLQNLQLRQAIHIRIMRRKVCSTPNTPEWHRVREKSSKSFRLVSCLISEVPPPQLVSNMIAKQSWFIHSNHPRTTQNHPAWQFAPPGVPDLPHEWPGKRQTDGGEGKRLERNCACIIISACVVVLDGLWIEYEVRSR